MENKIFGYPSFEHGEMKLCTYDNEYSDMLMDVRIYKMKKADCMSFESNNEEIALLLLYGTLEVTCNEIQVTITRRNVFVDGPYALHVSRNTKITVKAKEDTEILVQKTKNDKFFKEKIYKPSDAPWKYSSQGCYGDAANRRVNTIFDYDIQPQSNMVLGEVLNNPGNWSGYLPHRHPQPECYFFLFDHPEGFGASFIDDQVYKSVDHSFSAIPGGALHPQVAAPGFQMYTCWMIRHLDGNPWLQTDRCEDEAYTWLHDAEFSSEINAFIKK